MLSFESLVKNVLIRGKNLGMEKNGRNRKNAREIC